MKSNTGRSLDEWLALVKAKAPKDASARAAWLKSEHGLGTNYAGWIAQCVVGGGKAFADPARYLADAAEYVEQLYSGPRSVLRPIHDELVRVAFALSKEIKVCPCQTIVPLFRTHVIAQIKPATRTRVDFGLALGSHPGKLPARLIDTGGAAKKDRITHKLELTEVAQVDAEVARWLRVAYDLDG